MQLQRKYPWPQPADGTFLAVLQTCRSWAKFCFLFFVLWVYCNLLLFSIWDKWAGKKVCVVWPIILTSLPNSRLLNLMQWIERFPDSLRSTPPSSPPETSDPCRGEFICVYIICWPLSFLLCQHVELGCALSSTEQLMRMMSYEHQREWQTSKLGSTLKCKTNYMSTILSRLKCVAMSMTCRQGVILR